MRTIIPLLVGALHAGHCFAGSTDSSSAHEDAPIASCIRNRERAAPRSAPCRWRRRSRKPYPALIAYASTRKGRWRWRRRWRWWPLLLAQFVSSSAAQVHHEQSLLQFARTRLHCSLDLLHAKKVLTLAELRLFVVVVILPVQ